MVLSCSSYFVGFLNIFRVVLCGALLYVAVYYASSAAFGKTWVLIVISGWRANLSSSCVFIQYCMGQVGSTCLLSYRRQLMVYWPPC